MIQRRVAIPVQRGFSLVELVIVVAILGILGSMVAGRFTNSADMARDTADKIDAATVQKAIARYQADHGGTSPDFDTLAAQLTGFTNYQGEVGDEKDEAFRYGPYLPVMPNVAIQEAVDEGDVPEAPGSPGDDEEADDQPHIAKTWYYIQSTGRLYVRQTTTVSRVSNVAK